VGSIAASLKSLTELQCRQYSDDGIVFPVQVLSADEARRFRAASDELENRLDGRQMPFGGRIRTSLGSGGRHVLGHGRSSGKGGGVLPPTNRGACP
jgi:hypothetical protein